MKRCYDATRLPFWGAPDHFTVESPNTRKVAWSTKNGFGRMEDRDIFNGLDGWAGRDGRGSGKGGILLVEKENPN